MSVLNRTLDVSEQRKVFEINLTSAFLTNGITSVIGVVPYASTLDSAQIAVTGTSGAPSYQINVDRFIPGTGFTTIILATGTSNTPPAFGTSGVGISGMILATAGSTLLNLLPNDMLMLLAAGGVGAAAKAAAMAVVLLPIQDSKTHFGFAGK